MLAAAAERGVPWRLALSTAISMESFVLFVQNLITDDIKEKINTFREITPFDWRVSEDEKQLLGCVLFDDFLRGSDVTRSGSGIDYNTALREGCSFFIFSKHFIYSQTPFISLQSMFLHVHCLYRVILFLLVENKRYLLAVT